MSALVWLQIALEFSGNSWVERYPATIAMGYAIVSPKVVVTSAEEGREFLDPRIGERIAIEVHNVRFVAADQSEHPVIAEVVRADGVIVQSGIATAQRNWLGNFDATLKLDPIRTPGRYALRLVPITIANPPIWITTLPRLSGRSRELSVNVLDAE